MDAIRLELKNVCIAFETYKGNPNKLVGYQEITGHIVFDIKPGIVFRRKARYFGDGHKTEPPAALAYSMVVSSDSMRIILTTAAINGLEVMGVDVKNAFLTAPCKNKIWLIAGPYFWNKQGKQFLVVRAFYGLKSLSAAFRAYMADKLDEMGLKSSVADPDIWMRTAVKMDGEEYY